MLEMPTPLPDHKNAPVGVQLTRGGWRVVTRDHDDSLLVGNSVIIYCIQHDAYVRTGAHLAIYI